MIKTKLYKTMLSVTHTHILTVVPKPVPNQTNGAILAVSPGCDLQNSLDKIAVWCNMNGAGSN